MCQPAVALKGALCHRGLITVVNRSRVSARSERGAAHYELPANRLDATIWRYLHAKPCRDIISTITVPGLSLAVRVFCDIDGDLAQFPRHLGASPDRSTWSSSLVTTGSFGSE